MVVLSRRTACALASALSVAFAVAPTRAETPPAAAPPEARVSPPPSNPEVPLAAVALESSWPPPAVFERRSTGLLVTGVISASLGAIFTTSGVGVYAGAHDGCTSRGEPITAQSGGLFCKANRSQFDVGVGLMAAGGIMMAVGVPIAILGGMNAATPARHGASAKLVVGPSGAALVGAF